MMANSSNESRVEEPNAELKNMPQPLDEAVSCREQGDDGILPHGVIDPVYEAKAKVLNHAVRIALN
jgi:hypothetical protein